MRYRLSALLLSFLVTGCDIQQENGGGNIHLFSNTGLFVDQSWQVAQKGVSPDGDRICMVSAGGLDVTLTSHQGKIIPQVGPDEPLDIGYRFTVLVNGHNYETTNDEFDAGDSSAIVADFLKAPVVYTERLETQLKGVGHIWQRFNNTIKLDTFPGQYQACRKFVANKPARH